LGNSFGGCSLDLTGPGQGLVAGSYEHGNETLCSVKGGKCIEQISYHQLPKNNSAPLNSFFSASYIPPVLLLLLV